MISPDVSLIRLTIARDIGRNPSMAQDAMIERVSEKQPSALRCADTQHCGDGPRMAVFTGAGRVELRRELLPALNSGEVLTQLGECGLCAMEQQLRQGVQTNYPIIPGHEAAGTVVRTHKDGVLNAAAGDRVAIGFLDRCMQCCHCRRGDTHLCASKL